MVIDLRGAVPALTVLQVSLREAGDEGRAATLQSAIDVFSRDAVAPIDAWSAIQPLFDDEAGFHLSELAAGQGEALRAAHRQLMEVVGPTVERGAEGSFIGIPKKIDPSRLVITPRGVVAVKGSRKDEKGRQHVVVLRTPPWAVRDLFPYNVRLFVTVGARMDMATGSPATDREFLGYLGKFVLGEQGALLLGQREVADARRILSRSYLGRTWNVSQETLAISYRDGFSVPDLHAEAVQLESPFPLEGPSGLWSLSAIPPGGEHVFDEWRLRDIGDGRWRVFEGDEYLGDVDPATYPMTYTKPPFMQDVIEDPTLAIVRLMALIYRRPTVVSLGSGSGFTREEASSHMLIDESGDVTVVDPNINIIEDLRRLGVPPERVKRIVVSHVHFDHIAGLWRLIRRLPHKAELVVHSNPGDIEAIGEGRAGEGEMSTFKALVDAAVEATGGEIDARHFINAVTLRPMRFMEDMQLGRYTVRFFHGNHVHPSVGYMVLNTETGRPVFLFTGDTRLDARQLHSATVPDTEGKPHNVMTRERANFLANMVASTLLAGGIVFADAGVEPIHPSVGFYQRMLAGLEAAGISGEALEAIKSNLYLYHAAREPVEAAGLQYAGRGWADAVDLADILKWAPPRPDDLNERLVRQALGNVPVLASLPASDLETFAGMGAIVRYERGSRLMKQGEVADGMMLLLDGAVEVSRVGDDGSKNVLAVLTSGLIGEAAILEEGRVRNAGVDALTDVSVLEFGDNGMEFLRARGVAPQLVQLRQLREQAAAAEGKVEVLSSLDPQTRDAIFIRGEVVAFPDGGVIIREGDRDADIYVILGGDVEVSASKGPLASNPVTLSRGAVIGEGTLLGGVERSATVRAVGDVELLHLGEQDAREILEAHGGDLRYYLLSLVQRRGSVRSTAGETGTGRPGGTGSGEGNGSSPVPVDSGGGVPPLPEGGAHCSPRSLSLVDGQGLSATLLSSQRRYSDEQLPAASVGHLMSTAGLAPPLFGAVLGSWTPIVTGAASLAGGAFLPTAFAVR